MEPKKWEPKHREKDRELAEFLINTEKDKQALSDAWNELLEAQTDECAKRAFDVFVETGTNRMNALASELWQKFKFVISEQCDKDQLWSEHDFFAPLWYLRVVTNSTLYDEFNSLVGQYREAEFYRHCFLICYELPGLTVLKKYEAVGKLLHEKAGAIFNEYAFAFIKRRGVDDVLPGCVESVFSLAAFPQKDSKGNVTGYNGNRLWKTLSRHGDDARENLWIALQWRLLPDREPFPRKAGSGLDSLRNAIYNDIDKTERSTNSRRPEREVLTLDDAAEKRTSVTDYPDHIHDFLQSEQVKYILEEAGLSAEELRVFLLVKGEGYEYENVARMTGKKLGTVKSQMHRAMKKIHATKEHLEKI